jgi:uncharacterized protein (UPF0276 family)
MISMTPQSLAKPAVGIGFRLPIAHWTQKNLKKFDVLEITVDHYIHGGDQVRAVFKDLVGCIPLVAHGVGLSIGTDVPLDEWYLEQVARTIDDLKMPSYSEHLAWTKAPGLDLANLLPLPKNNEVADSVIGRIKAIQSFIPVPFALENISYIFDYPDSVLTDAQFFNLIFRETGVRMLLDVENLYVNSVNHGFDPNQFLDALPPGIVVGIHVAGGPVVSRSYLEQPVWVDNHSDEVPDQVLILLDRALADHRPESIVLERDDELEEVDEISRDVDRIRAYVDAKYEKVRSYAESEAVGSAN